MAKAKRYTAEQLRDAEKMAATLANVPEEKRTLVIMMTNSFILRRESHRNVPRHHERIWERGVHFPINTEPGADQSGIQSKEDAQIHGRQRTDRHGKRGIRLEAAILSKATI